MKILSIFAGILCVVFPVMAEYWQNDVHYVMDVSVDDVSKTFNCSQKLTYTNNSPDTLSVLYFRIAANSFQPGSPLHRKELNRGRDRYSQADPDELGYCQVFGIRDSAGKDIDHIIDYSLITLNLDDAVLPGESQVFHLDFETKLPSSRLGYRLSMTRGQYKAAHWYPQICVYDRVEGWVNNQYIGWGENYGDIGTYEVRIELPSEFIVAGTGVIENEEEVFPDSLKKLIARENYLKSDWPETGFLQGGRKTWKFRAENVCDFVFVADDEFCYEEAEYNGIRIKTYIRREHAEDWHDAAETGRKGIQYFSENFGRYAYPQMSITDSWSGMEYPMLVMCGGKSPKYYLLFWHEIAHNYFMGAVASNQTDRAFLDEGFTTYLEIAAMEHFLGREDNMRRRTTRYQQRFHPFEEDRVYRGFRPYMEPALQGYTVPMPMNADNAPEWWIYRASSYYKTVCMLFNLEYMFGRELVFQAVKDYYEDWKFKHPYEHDMFESIERSLGAELTWFFNQWVNTDKKLDYKVHSPKLLEKVDNGYSYRITVSRKDQMLTPLKVEVTLKNGGVSRYWIPLNDNAGPPDVDMILPKWDQLRNFEDSYSFEVTFPAKIKSMELDPESLLSDLYPMDNRQPFPRIQHDWLTETNYPPTHAYQVRERPEFGYNWIDGLELGFRSKGSYLEFLEKYDFGLQVGTQRLNADFDFKAENPLIKIHPRMSVVFGGFRKNGYTGGDFGVKYLHKPQYRGNPEYAVSFGYEYRYHKNRDYIPAEFVWDETADNSIITRVWGHPLGFENTRFDFSIRNSITTNNNNYARIELTGDSKFELPFGFGFTLSAGGGNFTGEYYPDQRLFYSGGWDSEIDRKYEYWGTNSLVPPEERMSVATMSSPGLYAMLVKRYGRKRYAVVTGELNIPWDVGFKVFVPFYGSIKPRVNMILFGGVDFDFFQPSVLYDNEMLWYYTVNPVFEAGPGIKITGIPGGEFVAAFPLFYHYPYDYEDDFDFRWAVVFRPDFKW